jgi:hypothetical protein
MTYLFLLLAPVILLAMVALLGFVGCTFQPGSASTPVDPPTNLTAVGGDSWVQLAWDAYPNATDFVVSRGVAAGAYTDTFDLMSSMNSYLDLTVTDGTTYHYAVEVTTADGTSGNSNDAAATPGAITYVQKAEIDVQTAGTTVTSNVFPAPLTAGNLIVVWVWYKVGAAPSHVMQITDTVGNQYLLAIGPTLGAGVQAGFQQEIWYAKNINGGTGVKVTAIFSANTTERAIGAHEYANADKNQPLVNTPVGMAGNGANATLGPIMTTLARIIFAAVVFQGQGTAGVGFTQRSSLQGNVTEDRAVTLPGSYSANFANTAQAWLAQLVTFR